MKRAYLAGPMRGRKDFGFDEFVRVAAELAENGWQVFNPAQRDIDLYGRDVFDSPTGDLADIAHLGFDLRDALATDLDWLARNADTVIVLPGWRRPSRARAEVAAAEALGLDVLEYVEHPSGWSLIPPAESICAEADRIVSGARQSDYGHPLDNFTQTGRLWAALLGLPEVTAEQVGLCMVAVKLSRQTNAPKRDNLVDIAGYAKTLDLIEQRRAREAG